MPEMNLTGCKGEMKRRKENTIKILIVSTVISPVEISAFPIIFLLFKSI